jgi:eukaryotic-like serine/threonine-protein kinase
LSTEQTREWQTFGRYVLLEKIGTGGMAEIFRAKTFGAAGFEKEYAIKLILPSLVDDKEFVEMFINEAKIAVSLYHANIVQVFDLGQIDGQYYIAMEFVHGKDLLDVLARCADMEIQIPLNIVLFIMMEMLKGLDFAHRAKDAFGEDLNIVHRDISPSNILLSYAGDVKVGDFGVAKAAIQRTMTESGTLKGKVGYMSPEQVMGSRIDARSDVFSAGIVLYEALGMTRLFAGGSDLDVMLRVRDADIEKHLRALEPLPSELRQIVSRALARHREERFQTAGELYQGLMDFCFRYNIKVAGSDLSGFVRRLFSAEIEREKARRVADRHAVVLVSGTSPRPPLADDAPGIAQPAPQIVETAERFRYRDNLGLIYGPMSAHTLVNLVRNRTPHDADRVSRDGATWSPLTELEELRAVLGATLPRPPEEVRRSHAGAAVFKPVTARRRTPDELPAADAASSGASAPSFSALEEESTPLADSPSPTAQSAPSVGEMQPHFAELLADAARDDASFRVLEGSFAQSSFVRLLSRLHVGHATGRLKLTRGEIVKSVYLRDGELILVDSNREEELLGTFLIARKIIRPEQLQEGLDRLHEWGGRLGDALVAVGAIPAHDIFQLLSDQLREKLLDVFSWQDGRYAYYENQEPETHGYPLDVNCYDVLATGCREQVSLDRLLSFYRDRTHTHMFMREPAPFSIDLLRLRGNETRVARQFESGMSLHELLRKFPPAQRELIYRTVYLLHQTELLTFEDTESVVFPI